MGVGDATPEAVPVDCAAGERGVAVALAADGVDVDDGSMGTNVPDGALEDAPESASTPASLAGRFAPPIRVNPLAGRGASREFLLPLDTESWMRASVSGAATLSTLSGAAMIERELGS